MPGPLAPRLLDGRVVAALGIVLVALNIRTAVAGFSPIIQFVGADIPLSSVSIGVLGMVPPLAFAASGLIAPVVAKRIGLEWALAAACAAMIVGPMIRAFAADYPALLIGTALTLAGMGFGNILLPPAVKRYFPDRIALMTTAYVTLLSVSTALPALVAVPLADAAGWRVSLGAWGLFAAFALIPWSILAVRRARVTAHGRAAVQAGTGEEEIIVPPAEFGLRLLRSRVAWALALLLVSSSVSVYSAFAWFPDLLVDTAGATEAEAGALLALYAVLGLPIALVIPSLVARMRNVGVLIFASVGLFVTGYTGLILAPAFAPWLWIVLAGTGPMTFAITLTLINLRTTSPEASAAVSGFVQAIGYGVGSLGPLVFGLLHTQTDSWTLPLLFLMAMSLLAVVSGVVLARPRFVEDELAAVAGHRGH
ncbi:MAG: MFS transporter [Salinibacterium sp.]|nr:MFS transporter [Salinibacterium sp.]